MRTKHIQRIINTKYFESERKMAAYGSILINDLETMIEALLLDFQTSGMETTLMANSNSNNQEGGGSGDVYHSSLHLYELSYPGIRKHVQLVSSLQASDLFIPPDMASTLVAEPEQQGGGASSSSSSGQGPTHASTNATTPKHDGQAKPGEHDTEKEDDEFCFQFRTRFSAHTEIGQQASQVKKIGDIFDIIDARCEAFKTNLKKFVEDNKPVHFASMSKPMESLEACNSDLVGLLNGTSIQALIKAPPSAPPSASPSTPLNKSKRYIYVTSSLEQLDELQGIITHSRQELVFLRRLLNTMVTWKSDFRTLIHRGKTILASGLAGPTLDLANLCKGMHAFLRSCVPSSDE